VDEFEEMQSAIVQLLIAGSGGLWMIGDETDGADE
jgi:hypothetical protein